MNPLRLLMVPLRLAAFAVVALAALPGCAGAEAGGAASARTLVTADLYGRAGPSGIMFTVGAQRRWDESDGKSPMHQGRYAAVGISVGSNPAYAQGNFFAEWVPFAPLQLRAQYDAFGFFGANGALLSFPSAGARFSDAELDARSGSERTGVGHRVMLSPILRAQLGPLLLRNQTDVAWYRLSSDQGWFHEWEYDTLLAGPAYEVTRAGKAHLTRQRVEGVVFWPPVDRLGAFARPRLLGVLGVNVQDRNREGDVFVVAGMGVDLDL
jgi:hypothetical protein